MKPSDNFWERQKNPLNWLVFTVFFAVLCVGLWMHNWLVIIIGIAGAAGDCFLMPAPTGKNAWFDALVDGIRDWIKKPMDAGKAIKYFVEGAGVVVLFWGLWIRNWIIVVITVIVLAANELTAMREALQKAQAAKLLEEKKQAKQKEEGEKETK